MKSRVRWRRTPRDRGHGFTIARPPQPAGFGDNAAMKILLNGQSRRFDSPRLSIGELLDAEGLSQRRVAVEVNGEIVPRGRHGEHALQPGDRVEIVHALGGG
jgi:sulfur carrier protein